MGKIDFDSILKDINCEISEDKKFTNDFKDFSIEALIICKLCNIFEEGTGRKIDENNIEDEKGVLSFIKSISPILRQKGVKITLDEKMIKKLIIDFYLQIPEFPKDE